eukprot:4772104-Amphidinium_carterae.1
MYRNELWLVFYFNSQVKSPGIDKDGLARNSFRDDTRGAALYARGTLPALPALLLRLTFVLPLPVGEMAEFARLTQACNAMPCALSLQIQDSEVLFTY